MVKKQQKFTLFYIAGDKFAMPLLEDSQFISCDKIVPLPNTDHRITGLVYHGGNIITVLNTAKFLDIKYKIPDEHDCLLFSFSKDFYGLIVDQGGETIKVNQVFTDRNKKQFKKYLKLNKQKIYILEPDKIMEDLKIYD